MNEINQIFIGDGKEKRSQTVTIFYSSQPYEGMNKKINHCNIFAMTDIKRITLNQSAFTLIFKTGFLKLAVPENFNLDDIEQLAEQRFNAGLKVIEHFSKFRVKNEKN